MLAKRVKNISESITIAISTLAKELKAKGEDVLIFSAGEPDFDTPKAIKDAVIQALEEKCKCSKYTPIPGTNDILEAIAYKLKKDNNLEYKTSQILTNVGAKHSLFNLFQVLLEEDDEVIIPAPYWVSYTEIVKFCGAKPVIINTDEKNGFKLNANDLKKAITNKTKLIIFNMPSNPTGAVYSKDEIASLGEVLKDTNIIVASDEIYEKLTYEGDFTSVASVSEDLFKRTITINGLSKCGAMPGWRFGYMASANEEIIKACKKLQSQSTSNISSLVQIGAIPALMGKTDEDIKFMKNEFQKRRDLVYALFQDVENLSLVKPNGAFYAFVNCKKIDEDSMRFCKKLLNEAKVAVVPGIGFGMDGYFRFSFATDEKSIIEGIKRISNFVKNYQI
ncbi:pyridoxal phosphate-dependent aminotransferase [Campylobacter sp. FMV-PI01]|uniref:Pyridoxal phosphate-dependent aminotransferase n=1 Tax=Campylobacter portucalensis TaxID=2608384 RepID=A0A6L5WHZ8_9BACT|nr:pyridoxal phosphate-dependent aminotransferase [Campylobacter portucalensis]MSN96820.1 pyridoxal phosphate-dependent aminotransferase [Campylobacter portucalensis]